MEILSLSTLVKAGWQTVLPILLGVPRTLGEAWVGRCAAYGQGKQGSCNQYPNIHAHPAQEPLHKSINI